jgi:diphthine synthase
VAELWFIGAGLTDERGLSERAWQVLAAAREIYAEEYTAVLAPGTLNRLGVRLGREVRRLDRAATESGEAILGALARGGPVAFVVPGDPFAATTHLSLRLACERAGHTWRYLPNASVLTAAAGFLGLIPYRFGRTVSLPFPDPHFAPTSPWEMIAENRTRRLHSLVLLDLRPDSGRFLLGGEAIELLLERDPQERAVSSRRPLGVVARVGTESAAAWFGPAGGLRTIDFGPPMHSLVVPADQLHPEERAAVARFEWPPATDR